MCLKQVASTGRTCNGNILHRERRLGSVFLIFKINNTLKFPSAVPHVSEVREVDAFLQSL